MKVVLDSGAKLPTKAHTTDAGYDLYAPKDIEPITLYSTDTAVIDTKVHMAIPEGYCGLITSKSGLHVNYGITSTGVIDESYRGTIRVKLTRLDPGKDPYTIQPGDKITQMLILPVPNLTLEVVGALDETERGDNGFGSSGR